MRATDIDEIGRQEQRPNRKRGGKFAQPWEGEEQGGFEGMGLFDEGAGCPVGETIHEKVLKLIDRVCASLSESDGKATVADLGRLMQLERELRPQGCERLVVEWVDPQPEVG